MTSSEDHCDLLEPCDLYFGIALEKHFLNKNNLINVYAELHCLCTEHHSCML